MNIKKLLELELSQIKVNEDEILYLKKLSELIIKSIERKLEKNRINASAFIGGSLAKETLIKKPSYDVDIFLRFSKNYSEEQIKKFMKKIFFWFWVPGLRIKVQKIRGSRDYYKIIPKSITGVSFEVIPSLKISSPNEARNITDLSFFHVRYVKDSLSKNKKIKEQILIAKSFCNAQKCYGAESYIKGFSGYAIELLMIYYKDFIKFLREISKKDELIIDIKKLYKSKKEIIESLNKAKHSPIILIDPTFKERNAAGALSKESFAKFQNAAKKFLENPSEEFFQYKKIDIPMLKTNAKEVNGIFAVFEIKTKKQPGDIAGSKMLKFSKVISREIGKYFDILESEYDYWGERKSHLYYVLKRKAEIVHVGPSIYNEKAIKGFKEKHKIWYVEDGRIKSSIPTDLSLKEFLKVFKQKYRKTMKEMDISKIKII
ncbi:MAG: nucleotidyltransferase domain-containing protein [Candidatus Pacearchaeota archaeon]